MRTQPLAQVRFPEQAGEIVGVGGAKGDENRALGREMFKFTARHATPVVPRERVLLFDDTGTFRRRTARAAAVDAMMTHRCRSDAALPDGPEFG